MMLRHGLKTGQNHSKSCIRQMAQLLPEAAEAAACPDWAPHVAFQEKAALKRQPTEAAFHEEGVPSADEGDSAECLPHRWV